MDLLNLKMKKEEKHPIKKIRLTAKKGVKFHALKGRNLFEKILK